MTDMAIERTVTFDVHDLDSIGVECEQCNTLLRLDVRRERPTGSLVCPICRNADGANHIIWTENEDTPDKRLLSAVFGVRAADTTRVRLIVKD